MLKKTLLSISFCLTLGVSSVLFASMVSEDSFEVAKVLDIQLLLHEIGCNDQELLTMLDAKKTNEVSVAADWLNRLSQYVTSCGENPEFCGECLLSTIKNNPGHTFFVVSVIYLVLFHGKDFKDAMAACLFKEKKQ